MEKIEKYRHEFKYICSDSQLVIINSKLKSIMDVDANVGETNSYRIRSIYFDDYYNSNYYDNENGVYKRAKWRSDILGTEEL